MFDFFFKSRYTRFFLPQWQSRRIQKNRRTVVRLRARRRGRHFRWVGMAEESSLWHARTEGNQTWWRQKPLTSYLGIRCISLHTLSIIGPNKCWVEYMPQWRIWESHILPTEDSSHSTQAYGFNWYQEAWGILFLFCVVAYNGKILYSVH